MNYEFLESAEFYNRRYHNFSSRIIIPTTVLLVFIILTVSLPISSQPVIMPLLQITW